jgi:CBS domain-containing protein
MRTGRKPSDDSQEPPMNDDHRHTDLPRPMPAGTRRPTAGIYRESLRNEQLGLLPGDVKQVKEVMSSKVTTATPRTSLTEAAGLMKKLDVPVVVVYDGARLKGMLTERDMALSQAIQRASPKAAIERFMRTSIPPCFDDDLLKYCKCLNCFRFSFSFLSSNSDILSNIFNLLALFLS